MKQWDGIRSSSHLTLCSTPTAPRSRSAQEQYIGEFRDMGHFRRRWLTSSRFWAGTPALIRRFFSMNELVGAFSGDALAFGRSVRHQETRLVQRVRSLTPENLAARCARSWRRLGTSSVIKHSERAARVVTDRLGKLTEAPDMLGFLFVDQVDLARESFGERPSSHRPTSCGRSRLAKAHPADSLHGHTRRLRQPCAGCRSRSDGRWVICSCSTRGYHRQASHAASVRKPCFAGTAKSFARIARAIAALESRRMALSF